MKKLRILAFMAIFSLFSMATYADDPPPPPGGSSGPPSSDNNSKLGGGAPVGSGLLILLGLGAAYGGKKVYDLRKKEIEE